MFDWSVRQVMLSRKWILAVLTESITGALGLAKRERMVCHPLQAQELSNTSFAYLTSPTGQLSETILRTHRCLISRLHPHIVYEHKGEGAVTHTERTTYPRDEEESALIPLCSFAGACEPLPPVLEWWQFHPGRVCKPVPQPAPPRWLAAACQLPPVRRDGQAGVALTRWMRWDWRCPCPQCRARTRESPER